ncbi:MAG: hypothetical protein Kow009_04890 [Spirochaetales bacterium]
MPYFLASLGCTALFILYILYILPRRRQPSRFRTSTAKRMLFYLYLQGRWNREILLPWEEVQLKFDPGSGPLFLSPEEVQPLSIQGLPTRVLLSPTEEYLRVTSDRPLLIQGVERSSGWLRTNGILRAGSIKLVFKGMVEERKRIRVKPSFGAWANAYGPGIGFATLALLFLVLGWYTIRPAPILPAPSLPPEGNTEISGKTGKILSPSDRQPAEAMEPAKEPTVSGKEPLPDFPDTPMIVEPGSPIPSRPIRVLFLHAHPDDESIEFGTLMATCRSRGIPTATVLFTDGEGGIFSQEYTGPRTTLPAIRIREAAWALHTLGSSLYIRLGFSNHPYNGVQDEQRVEEVIQRWGSDQAIGKVVEILLSLKPEIVVSPEEPSSIRKHFEHEAVAVLVREAIEKVKRMGYGFPKGYLQSLDPRYATRRGENVVAFTRAEVLGLQRTALSIHRTQADAFYFGLRRAETYPEEIYRMKFWDLSEDPRTYFNR